MALHIIKEAALLADLSRHNKEYATVESDRRTGLKRLFGPKVGNVSVSRSEKSDVPLFRVTIPKWKGGEAYEWILLQRCYRAVLQTASEQGCQAIVLPLLTAEDPAFPANIDYKIAVDIIREFLNNHSLDVYLTVFRPNAVPLDQRRMEVEAFLYLHEPRQQTAWCPTPFAADRDPFDTLAPLPSRVQESEPAQTLDDAIEDWLEFQSLTPMESAREPIGYDAAVEDKCSAPSVHADWEEEECAESVRQTSRKKAVIYDGAPRPSNVFPKSAKRRPNLAELEKRLKATEAGFSETLLKLIDQTGKKDSEIYNKANVSRQHFSKIRNNPHYKPTKQTAIAFAIALELDMTQTKDLIGRAGYTLTTSSKFDTIIMYFIQEGIYDMFDINETLYEFDQSLLGA